MSHSLRVLIVDDSEEDALLIMEILKRGGFDLSALRVDEPALLEQAIKSDAWDVVLSDHTMPGFSSQNALAILRQYNLDLPFIIVSGASGEDVAIAEMKAGAHDYIIKGQYARLIPAIEREMRDARNRQEKRKAESQLRDQAELLDKAQDAIIVTDLNEQIEYWNKSAELLYGWPVSEAVSQSMKDLLSPLCSDKHSQAFQHALTQGEWKGELDHKTKSNQFLLVQSRLTLVKDHDGRPQRMLVVNTDLTEQKRWEVRFLRSQRMESLGTLASGIAHDLNNVLAPILMAVHFLQDSVQDESSRTMLATLEKSALRGADIIRQVLTFARGIEGERCLLNLAFLIKDMAKIIEETFPKSIVAKLSCPSSLWSVRADATQLNQVLMNLCINARDAMGDGGQLSIQAENAMLDE